jgi:hypothetical protein
VVSLQFLERVVEERAMVQVVEEQAVVLVVEEQAVVQVVELVLVEVQEQALVLVLELVEEEELQHNLRDINHFGKFQDMMHIVYHTRMDFERRNFLQVHNCRQLYALSEYLDQDIYLRNMRRRNQLHMY